MNLREWVEKTMTEEAQKYYEIIFLQGEEADEILRIIKKDGEEAALDKLTEHDFGKEMEHTPEEQPWDANDETYEKDDYVMSWNTEKKYASLVRKVKKEEEKPAEPEEVPPEEIPEETPPEGKEGE